MSEPSASADDSSLSELGTTLDYYLFSGLGAGSVLAEPLKLIAQAYGIDTIAIHCPDRASGRKLQLIASYGFANPANSDLIDPASQADCLKAFNELSEVLREDGSIQHLALPLGKQKRNLESNEREIKGTISFCKRRKSLSEPSLLERSTIDLLEDVSHEIELFLVTLIINHAYWKSQDHDQFLNRTTLVRAHFLKEPLQRLSVSVQDFQEKQIMDERVPPFIAKALEWISKGHDRFTWLQDQVKRHQKREFKTVNIRDLLSEILSFYEQDLKRASVQWIGPTSDVSFECYASNEELKQIFTNVITNAIRALSTGPNVHDRKLTIALLIPTKEQCLNPDEEVLVEIKDNGRGFATSREKRDSQTNAQSERGMGIGLALDGHILAQHNGRMEILSHPGEGTIVRIFLKRKKRHATETTHHRRHASLPNPS